MDNQYEFQPNNAQRERRKFKRIDKNYIVSYALLEGEELKFDVSQTKNISEGGLLFIAGRAFEKNVMLKIQLRLPTLTDYAVVKAQVVASRQLAKGMMYEIRAKFINVKQDIRDAVKRLVDYHVQ